jgi:hypothetical protein
VSVVTEKARALAEFGGCLNVNVEAYYGSNGPLPIPPGNQIAVCTIEKVRLVTWCVPVHTI